MPIDGPASEKTCTVAVNTLLCGLSAALRSAQNLAPVQAANRGILSASTSVIIFRSQNSLADTQLQRCTFVVDEQKVLGGCYLSRCKAKAYLRQQLVAHLLLLPFSRPIEYIYYTTILMSVLAPEHSVHLHPRVCLEVPDAGHLMYSLPPIIGTTHQCCVLYQFVVFAKCE